jgi:hypothetical protein
LLEEAGGPPDMASGRTGSGYLYGTVTILDSQGRTVRTVVAGVNGRYFTYLPSGTYSIEGHSPQYDGGTTACLGAAPLVVASSRPVQANVYCEVR